MDRKRRSWRAWKAAAGGALLVALGVGSALAQNPAKGKVPAPALVDGPWINTPDGKPLTLAGLKGRVTILHFWTFGCINCKRNLPAYARWEKRFAKHPVTIIGIHTPETDGERKLDNVRKYVKEYPITYPVLVDEQAANWNRWAQKWWPTVYLIDKHGFVRYRWEGELAWQGATGESTMGDLVDRLLAEE